MKKIAYIICGVVALMATHTLSAQTLNTAYFMEGAYQRTNLNPALTPTRDYFSLPVLGGTTLELSSNYLALHNYFFKHGDQTVTALHGSVTPSEFLGNFAQNNKLSFGINSSLLGVGFRHKNMYWNFGLNLRSQSDGVLSKDLFSAIKTFGNGDYDLGNTSLNSTTYAEVYLGTTYDVLDWITVGARAKFLIGILNLTSEFDAMHISVSSNRIIGQMRGTLRLNGVCFNSNNVNEGDDLSGDIFNMGSISSFGAAIDLGTEIRLLDNRLKISAAVTDLGFIRWSKDGYIEASTSGDFHFNGFNLEKVEADAAGDFNATYRGVKSTGYTTRINCSLNVGAEYNVLNNRIADYITTAVNELNADKRYKMIVDASSLIDASADLDMTAAVLAKVNEYYAAGK